jgi:5-oxoprolinase (ATP-hydrolysing) subunit A
MSARAVDLNADLGEEPDALERDTAILEHVTSANVACGGHAGDERSMRALARRCRDRGVALGAHPSYPDRAGFGRIDQDLAGAALEDALHAQIAALAEIAAAEGARLAHVKPHGALYHACARRGATAESFARAARAVSPRLVLVAPCGSAALALYRSMGFAVAAEAFADRHYEPDGRLRPRALPGALLERPADAAAQALRLALGRDLLLDDGTLLPAGAETLCLHGDTPGAPEIAREVRRALEAAGVRVAAPSARS